MQWPPNKAWTSSSPREGFRHFVATSYGGRGADRWVHLISVLDGKAELHISWQEMKDPSLWTSGWLQLPKEQAIEFYRNQDSPTPSSDNKPSCLHPSRDFDARPWFVEEKLEYDKLVDKKLADNNGSNVSH